jgi:GT2 family glycosyltransferase
MHDETVKRVLVAVVTCHKYRDRANAQRETWVKDVPDQMDVRFFLGRPAKSGSGPRKKPLKDEVWLDVSDGYQDLPAKVVAVCEWALKQGYDYLCKIDDDVYLRPERLMNMGLNGRPYMGRLRGPSGNLVAPYCSGLTYVLNRDAMKVVLATPINDYAEDRFVGNALYSAGIIATPDYRFVVTKSTRNAKSGREGPRQGNFVISSGEYDVQEMHQAHKEFLTVPSKVKNISMCGRFQDVAVMIKTFLRDGHLFKTVQQVENFLPGAKMIIVDDGRESREKIELYAKLRMRGHDCLWLPFDSGFCAKSNMAVEALDRPYMLIASDDFEFDKKTSDGVAKLLDVLEEDHLVGVASGTVDKKNYQGFIEKGPGYIKEIPLVPRGELRTKSGTRYDYCDITVNYCLVRRDVLQSERVGWDEKYKIGGDHFEFFDQVRAEGWKAAIVSEVNINQRKFDRRLEHPEYQKFRGRAKQSLPRFFEKYNIERYIAFDGREDVLLPSGEIISKAPPWNRPPLTTTIAALHRRDPGPVRGSYVTKERLYLTADDRVVTENERGKKRLFAGRGRAIPMATAIKYGLVEVKNDNPNDSSADNN